ncbi:uncharacterized protein LOC133193781 [Saccostrea echinata]|uniref:uncharacterized protein LOC133193781 n=1 Tax=Saccostrea echinata TaxID=191078 RepID=UPI002A833527|nr:uncharacterized protein LOC133193781 [Saccostrea echinata]
MATSSRTSNAPPLTEEQMVKGMKEHYKQKEEGLSQVKLQVEIIWSTIQKRFQHICTREKENFTAPSLTSEDKDQILYLNQQLTQLSDNLRRLVSDENQEQRHLDYIKVYCQQYSKKDNSNFMREIQELQGMHSANCLQTEEIENHINRGIRHLSKIKRALNGEVNEKESRGQGQVKNTKVTYSQRSTIKSALQERN